MALSATHNKHIYNGDGVQTVWPYTFELTDVSHVHVYVTDEDSVLTELSSGFTVDEENKTVTYPVDTEAGEILPEGEKITIERKVPFTQESTYSSRGSFNPKNAEADFDRLVMLCQQLQEVTERCVKYTVDHAVDDADIADFFADMNDLLDLATAARDAAIAAQEAAETAQGESETAQAASEEAQEAAETAQAAAEEAQANAESAAEDANPYISGSITVAEGLALAPQANRSRQMILAQGDGGAVTLADAPFGNSAPNGTELKIIGTSDENTITVPVVDDAYGFHGNGNYVISKCSVLVVVYSSVLQRWVEQSRTK